MITLMKILTNKELNMTTDIDYEPLTEEEALGLFPKGEYEAVILESKSQSGRKDPSKSFVVLKLEVTSDKQKKEMTVWCFMPFMLKHASEATGNTEKYQNKTLKLSDFVGKRCKVKIRVKEGNDQYPSPKNEIYDFVSTKNQSESLPFNDEVPF
jgi:hypothetical protein